MEWWTKKVNYDSDEKLNVKETEENGREMQRHFKQQRHKHKQNC